MLALKLQGLHDDVGLMLEPRSSASCRRYSTLSTASSVTRTQLRCCISSLGQLARLTAEGTRRRRRRRLFVDVDDAAGLDVPPPREAMVGVVAAVDLRFGV